MEATSYILLRYAYDPGKAETVSGEVVHVLDKEQCVLKEFAIADYAEMLRLLSSVVRERGDQVVAFHRRDLKTSPVVLDEATVKLLTEDVEEYIKRFTIAPRVVTREPRDQALTVSSIALIAGHDALADAFGDELYLRTRREGVQLECVGCGRWMPSTHPFSCCGLPSPKGHHAVPGWMAVPIGELLRLNLDRYYLPRPWNPSGSWIKFADLQSRYERFCAERMNA